MVSKRFLAPRDRVLLVDDFLARGQALLGLINIVHQSGATPVGAGIAIEKAFQDGGNRVTGAGVEVYSLARIASLDHGKVLFS